MFLQASGADPGAATSEFMRKEVEDYDAYVEACRKLLADFRDRILLPTDVVLNDGGKRKVIHTSELPARL